jgi:hypothetical protein
VGIKQKVVNSVNQKILSTNGPQDYGVNPSVETIQLATLAVE